MNARERTEAVKNSPIIRIRDVIALIIVTAAVVGVAIAISLGGKTGVAVYITAGGETTSYPLSENRTIDLGSLKVVIEDGSAFVTDSTCPDGLCEKSGRISGAGQSITCLPAGVVVRIGESEFDAVTGGAP